MKKNKFKFCLTLGTSSIGWAVYELNENLNPIRITKTGVRIFADGRQPQTGESLAVNRRVARGTRRKRDRFIKRKQALMKNLISFGLMPKEEIDRQKLKSLDVYRLRALALKDKVELFELGRVLYHLNQRRGFLSSRKFSNVIESKINDSRINNFKKHIAEHNFNSIGEYLFSLNQLRKPLRFISASQHFPDRGMYEEEFDLIVSAQKKFHPSIPEEYWLKIKSIIFFQRPLKSKKDYVGLCEIFSDKKRTYKSSIYFQRFCLLQSIAKLKTINEQGYACEISVEDKSKLYDKLSTTKELSFDRVRKELNLGKDVTFNIENLKNKKILGDGVSEKLKDTLKEAYEHFSLDELNEISLLIASDDEDFDVTKRLVELGVPQHLIDELLELDLPKGYCYLSHEALVQIVFRLESEFCSPEIIIGELKGEDKDKQLNSFLKYYGEVLPASVTGADKQGKTEEQIFGKISNPTVHICLNQLRKITNELIASYGSPERVVLEVADGLKKNRKIIREIEKKQNENRNRDEQIIKILIEELHILKPSRANITKYILWKELSLSGENDNKCPYSLKNIPISLLFSEEVEVKHILPFYRTLDDSLANKTLSYRSINKIKENKSPYEAFGNGKKEKYEKILFNSLKFQGNKKWKFQADALERCAEEQELYEKHLNDAAYVSRIIKSYMEGICNDVVVVSGKFTPIIRQCLGLNSTLTLRSVNGRGISYKRHAVNALVVGISTKVFIQKIIKSSENAEGKIVVDEPFSEFGVQAKKTIDELFVSRKEDHGVEAKFHEDTYYGILDGSKNAYEKKHGYNLVTRKQLSDLKEKDVDSIRSLNIRKKFANDSFIDVIKELQIGGTRRLRFLKKDKSVQRILHPHETFAYYKGIIPGDNHSLEVWKVPAHKDKNSGLEKPEELKFIVYNFYEKAIKINKAPHPSAKKLFTLHKGDNILMKKNNTMILVNLRTIRPSKNLIGVVPIDSQARLDNETDWPTFLSFKAKELRKVKITTSGKILDPGNPYN